MATLMVAETLSFQQQFHILLNLLRDPQGKPYSLGTLAQAAGVSDQSLTYLLDGRSQSPRLETIRSISHFYHISLDYFDCATESECRAYLVSRLAQSSSLLQDIAAEAATLTPKGQRNVLTMLEWLRQMKKSAQFR